MGGATGRSVTSISQVPDGSITALVGPNGSGKSTLLKAWVGFEPPTEGYLTVDGIDPWKDRAGAIAADRLRAAGAVALPRADRRRARADGEDPPPGFDPAIARHRLDDLDIPLDSRADELSGGQQAQVGLALALGVRAPVLLLDEPLASLDPLARREFLHVLVDAVRADGATALLSSHVITDIEQACDRLLVLGGGKTLLDLSIAGAIAEHRVIEAADGRPPAPRRRRSSGAFPVRPVSGSASSAAMRRPAAARPRSRRSSSATSPPRAGHDRRASSRRGQAA